MAWCILPDEPSTKFLAGPSRVAYADIQPLLWGPRLSLVEATDSVRTFLGGMHTGLGASPDESPEGDSRKRQL